MCVAASTILRPSEDSRVGRLCASNLGLELTLEAEGIDCEARLRYQFVAETRDFHHWRRGGEYRQGNINTH